MKRLVYISLTCTVCILVVLGFLFYDFLSFAHKTTQTIAKPSDSIVVLTGGAQRVNAGLDLLKANLAPQLFISGVGQPASREKLIELWGKKLDIPCCIYIDKNAQNTFENAANIAKWVKAKKVKSTIIVTSDFHMPRSLKLLKHKLPEIKFIPFGVKSDKTMLFKMNEFFKYIYVSLLYDVF